DYALWEVILNGDSPPSTRSVDGVETAYPPTTADEKLARKNELKVRGPSSITQNTQNAAFVSSNNTDNTSKVVNTAHGVSAASFKTNASNLPNVDSLKDRLEVANGNANHESQKIPTKDKKESRLLDSQQCDKSKTGLGYDSQVLENQVNDKYNIGKGYHAVPLPYTRNFMPFKPDLVFANEHVVSESVTSVPGIAKSDVKTSESKLKTISEPIIKDWVSKSKDENEIEIETKQIKPSFAKVNNGLDPQEKLKFSYLYVQDNPQQELQEKWVIDSG
nr:hypothetical protein [Tanacetum cinerariifolium]